MNRLEKRLLSEVSGGRPRLAVRTRTRIDVGRWWWPARVWLCVVEDELVILAVGRRRFVAHKPLAEIGDSYYCHATGKLAIEPGEELTFNRFKMSPGEALPLLAEIHR